MKKLPEKFTKKGIQYEIIQRTQFFAFLAQYRDGKLIGHIVSRVFNNPAREIAGKQIEESESIACAEQFGSYAFQYLPSQFLQAQAKFNEMLSKCENNS